MNVKAWLSAFRLRTLPLATACIGMGSFLAADAQAFQWTVFVLCMLTAIFLQILSNLANDYGDSIHGADSAERKGPSRAVQTGAISKGQMFRAIVVFALLSLGSGVYLLYQAISLENLQTFFVFLGLGVVAIWAAMTYTMGKNPYGYMGLGDISVLLFFGLLGVGGTYFLHTSQVDWKILLPAASCGLFATGVLNINNIRDIESDKKAGKYSIPVRLGRKGANFYHLFLLVSGFSASLVYVLLSFETGFEWLFLLSLPLFLLNIKAVFTKTTAQSLDPYLKQMALSTLVFVLTFGIGQLL